jgi:hypothetical protein
VMGDWENAYSHYRYHSHEKLNIVEIQPRCEQSEFWKKHFARFVKNPIPSVIDTPHLHQAPKGRHNYNRVQPYYSDIARGNGHNENDSDVTGRLLPKPRLNTQNKNPRQVLGPKSAQVSRPAQPVHPAKAPCPAYPTLNLS